MICEPGKNYLLENCGKIPNIQFIKKRKCEERNRQRKECMNNAGNVPCKNNCASWFPGNYTLTAACQAGCDAGNNYESMCDYLENYVGDQQTIAYYGIDCDLNTGSGSKTIADRNKNILTYTIVGIVIIVLILILYFIL